MARGVLPEYSDDSLHTRFQLQEILGRGAYGTVYKAQDTSSNEVVAIKIISLTENDLDDLKQIQKEIEYLADCNHPNIVKYLGSYRSKGSLWIVMEHCGGGSVNDLLSAGGQPLEEDMIAHICCESLKGLAYLHSLGKVHRDIKCGNILLSDSGEVKLADFGVAAQLTATITKRQTFIGTPHWMAPEVIQESRYDGKVDVWALGISAIEMAEMTPPRWAVHPMRVIFMISRDPPPQLQDGKWSAVFRDFVAQCLQKDAKARPTARYLLQHRYVVQQRPGMVATMMPLLTKTQEYIMGRSALAERAAGAQAMAQHATGRFSWRGERDSDSTLEDTSGPLSAAEADKTLPSAVPLSGHRAAVFSSSADGAATPSGGAAAGASPGQLPLPSESPARPAEWGGTLPSRGRGRGLPAAALGSSPAGGGPSRSTASVSSSWQATVDVRESSSMAASGEYAGTMVVHDGPNTPIPGPIRSMSPDPPPSATRPDYLRSAAAAYAPASDYASTMVVTPAAEQRGCFSEDNDSYMAALRAAGADVPCPSSAAGEDDSYMAALRSAAAESDRRPGSQQHSPINPPSTYRRVTSQKEQARLAQEAKMLERIHAIYEGGLVIPLPAMKAANAAPLALLNPSHTPLTTPQGHTGGIDGIDPDAYEVLLELVQEAQPGAVSRSGSKLAVESSGGQQGAQQRRLPPAIARKALASPVLQNLARTLAYHKTCLAQLPLDKAGMTELLEVVDDLSHTLRSVLCL